MTALAKDVSKPTDRYQTTVPAGVRKQLKLGKGDQIRYCTEPSEMGDIGMSDDKYDEILRSPNTSVHLPFAASCTNW